MLTAQEVREVQPSFIFAPLKGVEDKIIEQLESGKSTNRISYDTNKLNEQSIKWLVDNGYTIKKNWYDKDGYICDGYISWE